MIGSGVDTFFTQVGSYLLGGFTTETVDDACIVGARLDEVENKVHFLGRFVASFYRQTEVRTIETRYELARVP